MPATSAGHDDGGGRFHHIEIWPTRYVDQIHVIIVRAGVMGMNNARRATLDFETIVNAFDAMGRYLRDECSLVGEIGAWSSRSPIIGLLI
jgi:hypothetical protein